MTYKIINGNNIDVLKQYPDNHFDSIITDPPYGINFLGKDWDSNTGETETYRECLRVLKPGGYILAFSAARTYHHLAMSLEKVGFEVRDQIMWIYGSGFPKSQDIGKQIDKQLSKLGQLESEEAKKYTGWGTSLKPAHEPICMARKPIKLSIVKNMKQHGVGGLNIDATRIEYQDENDKPVPHGGKARTAKDNEGWMNKKTGYKIIENPEINPIGRFPSNVIGEISGEYQKYFYCPKTSKKERHTGITILTDEEGNPITGNNHPTVKPVELMKYLIKLVTPPNGKVLDPFNGSGSTGMAAVELGYDYTGIELDPNYVEISNNRIKAWINK